MYLANQRPSYITSVHQPMIVISLAIGQAMFYHNEILKFIANESPQRGISLQQWYSYIIKKLTKYIYVKWIWYYNGDN